MAKRLFKVQDDEFETLLSCFAEDMGKGKIGFSERFLDIVFQVIMDKKDRF